MKMKKSASESQKMKIKNIPEFLMYSHFTLLYASSLLLHTHKKQKQERKQTKTKKVLWR